ncbi:mucin-2-like [Dorcoceras hygrometricum]|uniref:Mucin-2-like n=1 Tax=Dorcoceras hygrometricum TaxID=472368 RepID=A0A2Z7C4B0_9LAMI|nr:mucin-2-like [Dorcoceras hygrometricum]
MYRSSTIRNGILTLQQNTIHVCFDSVLAMDNAGTVAMFRALAAYGLQKFLGFPPVIFETTLVEFFHNASVRDGLVVSTIHGQQVEISKEMFASTLKLPTEGLSCREFSPYSSLR